MEPATPAKWVPTGRLAELARLEHPDEKLSLEAARLVFDGVPKNTRETYARQWWKFVRWCGETGRIELPAAPATCIEWIAELGRRKGRYGRPTAPETIALSLKVIAVAHKRARRPDLDHDGRPQYGYVPPTAHPDVHAALRGYRRRWLEAGHRPDTAFPLSPEQLSAMVATLDQRTPMGKRDAALLAVGYDGGFRVSELCAINIEDTEINEVQIIVGETPDGEPITELARELVVHVPMSKTDQTGEGDIVVLMGHPAHTAATCPVRLAEQWLACMAEAGFTTGPLFRVVRYGGPGPSDPSRARSGKVVDMRLGNDKVEAILSATSNDAGLHAGARRRHVVPHSLRAGSATASAEAGADVPEIAEHFRWKPGSPTPMRYIRFGRKRSKNPVAKVWRRRRPVGGDQEA